MPRVPRSVVYYTYRAGVLLQAFLLHGSITDNNTFRLSCCSLSVLAVVHLAACCCVGYSRA